MAYFRSHILDSGLVAMLRSPFLRMSNIQLPPPSSGEEHQTGRLLVICRATRGSCSNRQAAAPGSGGQAGRQLCRAYPDVDMCRQIEVYRIWSGYVVSLQQISCLCFGCPRIAYFCASYVADNQKEGESQRRLHELSLRRCPAANLSLLFGLFASLFKRKSLQASCLRANLARQCKDRALLVQPAPVATSAFLSVDY
ncbi:hypothetical protein BS78_07G142600 [Paspalum vaginatum]|nr:hypothetical protein BS78_07G142600 [Paspalum vaginatum]